MTEAIHHLIEQYGLVAVFLGCVAEGESAAILAGFFAHQHVFVAWQAFLAAAIGAFAGDTFFFILGRSFADHPYVLRLKARPGFSHAFRLVSSHPNIFVLSNRYIYGMRLVGGVAAGFASITVTRFVVLNAISSLVWAALFCTVGYVFGLGAERIVGQALARHERLLTALAIGLAVAFLAWFLAHSVARKERANDARDGQSEAK
ncbi:DedA family protein [Mesorhizobium sp. M4B.F.Ca.ET.215.01.1.1]|uniref:DedA family protein n=1 Tax=unclassified Mesorhizobium TaxID=325217 RepID=UPI000FCB37F2|nr:MULTISPECIES: DedA family protein [unclassified Mesorhizobium]RUW22086.1 DedA family protein [Mesorhizobium sp. M4B.F.Ca.ET.013.02.1.1]RVD45384.1 DedA family protein [Mesorhizobium sp. M4B.F.Ca.ET.019.03.1.1]RWF66511.1 MAG: DedA family protein [Mesorhizobium sp.]TGQ08328.1 DedA family protein [Mesorhizobium sp. M4B.F.Ca.ET.215.01.1.1]TGQ33818.1 DedA family protein [Mesorhizobium sp. M4B.F.Ca.ET.214.01.1.1]